MIGSAGVLSSPALKFSLNGVAPVLDGRGVVVGTSARDRHGFALWDVLGAPVLRVGRCEHRILRNDRYPVFDASDVQIGWLGSWEGVIVDGARIAKIVQTGWSSRSARVQSCGRRPVRVMAEIEQLPRPGRRSRWFSPEWELRLVDVDDARLRLLVLASVHVWDVGRFED
jgi:hypothetical protein